MTDVEIAMSRLRNKEPLADIDYEVIVAVIDHFESTWDEVQGVLAQKRKLKDKLHGNILTSEQASEANLCWGMSLSQESLVINRLAATVIYLYEEVEKRPLGLDRDAITEAINSELDWLTIDQCGYAADSVISSVTLLNLEIK